MERKVVLASHGKFASGILSSLELICGKNKNISALDCYLEETFDLTRSVAELIAENQKNEIIIVTDIFGGSVNNEFLRYIENPNFYLIAGLNLPFLVELVTQLESTGTITIVIQQALDSAKKSIQFCNESIQKEIKEEDF
ncbi:MULTISPECIES: PTS sugar transporter subunit IIA [Enterococcus]|uniref:PTS sugar transporter subunit IIA n=1 Tax=Enterococcus TaxID=1350 RepID=UPI0010F78A82|nr:MULTISPECIES: PTS sugar transporter subunit IIA [Enterococcus]KAF1300593.1 PTS mannose transporter subunit IIA [Enterococcus sp. JM9B]